MPRAILRARHHYFIQNANVCYTPPMRRFLVLRKQVGQTPLQVVEAYKYAHPEYQDVPMAYAGRLDPMASGLLLVLVGDECKLQEHYHGLDKEYVFEVLFGVESDTADVLGLLSWQDAPQVGKSHLRSIAKDLTGSITLPYPSFSSKTVQGKPLHTWTLEGRLNEIEIPTKTSRIYKISCNSLRTVTKSEVVHIARNNIESIPLVTDPRKVLGADFRRTDVRASWAAFTADTKTPATYQIARFTCIASSGTYMRTLAEVIAKQLGTKGLAYSIHRTVIGRYRPLPLGFGYWSERFLPESS